MAVSCARQVRAFRAGRRDVLVDVLVLGAPGIAEPRVEPRDGGCANLLVPPETEPGLASNQAWVLAQGRHRRNPYTHVVGFGAAVGGFHAVTFGAWLGLPATVLVRGNDFDRDWFFPPRSALVHEALRRASAIGAVTLEKAARIRALFPDQRVEWTPNSVDPERWRLLPADRVRREEVRGLFGCGGAPDSNHVAVIGLFGELKAKKRIPFWLEAVRDAGLLTSIRLLVAGTLDAETSAILDDPAIAPRSLRLPFQDPQQLPGLYAAADFVAIPSMYEGMPNVLLEAMACGAIPIVSDAGAMSEVVTDGATGFLFAAEDRAAAGAATAKALALDAGERAALSAQVRNHVTSAFSPQRELDALCRLIGI